MDILALFGLKNQEAPAPSDSVAETIRKISDALDKLDDEQAKYVASFAYILGRVAHADLDISKEETREMERVVEGMGALLEEQAVLVVEIAKAQNRLFGSTENFLVTREFRRLASREQKIALLNCLFAVSSSDQSISTVEDNEIRSVSKELGLDHSDFIAARRDYIEHFEVLKKPVKGKP